MRATWDRVAPKGWALFCVEWGVKWGRLAVIDLETEALECLDRTLREVPMKTVMTMVAAHLSRQGWGQVTADFKAARQGAFVMHLKRGAFAESIGFRKCRAAIVPGRAAPRPRHADRRPSRRRRLEEALAAGRPTA